MIQVPTNSDMENISPTLSKNSNNLPINTLNINFDLTLQLSTVIIITNNESPKSSYHGNLNLLTQISPLISGRTHYKSMTTSRIQPMSSPITQVNTTALHLNGNQYMSHKYIIIHLLIIHLNSHSSQLIPELVPHKPTTT